MSGISNRQFSACFGDANSSRFEAFKSLTTNRNWNRGTIKVCCDDTASVSGLRCVNHSINPFKTKEGFTVQEVKDLNDTFKTVIVSEVSEIGRIARENVVKRYGADSAQVDMFDDNIKALKDRFADLVTSNIKETTDFWGEHTEILPLSRKAMGAIILQVDALRKTAENPAMVEMWTASFDKDDMVALQGKSDQEIMKLIAENHRDDVSGDETSVQEEVKPGQKGVKSGSGVSSGSPIEMSEVDEATLSKSREEARKFGKEVFGELARLRDRNDGKGMSKWVVSFRKKMKDRFGSGGSAEASGEMNFKLAVLMARGACKVALRSVKSEKDKAFIVELDKMISPFEDLKEAAKGLKEKLSKNFHETGSKGSRGIVKNSKSCFADGTKTCKEWANVVVEGLRKGIYKFNSTTCTLDDTPLSGNRVWALNGLVEKLRAANRAGEFQDSDSVLISDVCDELESLVEIAKELDAAEVALSEFESDFMKGNI